METNKTSSEILLEAAAFLEKENRWNKGAYFKQTDQGCKMCAHGAIAFCGNPEVKEKVLNDIDSNISTGCLEEAAGAAAVGARAPAAVAAAVSFTDYYTNLAQKENLTPEQWIVKHYGQTGLAHYKAFKNGLTYDFNDHPNTTKQDVINKLREAAYKGV